MLGQAPCLAMPKSRRIPSGCEVQLQEKDAEEDFVILDHAWDILRFFRWTYYITGSSMVHPFQADRVAGLKWLDRLFTARCWDPAGCWDPAIDRPKVWFLRPKGCFRKLGLKRKFKVTQHAPMTNIVDALGFHLSTTIYHSSNMFRCSLAEEQRDRGNMHVSFFTNRLDAQIVH